jgi:hypothetical protein
MGDEAGRGTPAAGTRALLIEFGIWSWGSRARYGLNSVEMSTVLV